MSNPASDEELRHMMIGCTAIAVFIVCLLAAVFTVVVVSIMWAASRFF